MLKKVKILLLSIFVAAAFCAPNASALSVVSLEKTSEDTENIELNEPTEGYYFDANFLATEQTLTFKATIKNDDVNSIKINNVTLNESEHEFLEYSYDGIDIGEILQADSSKTFTITVKTNDKKPSTVTEDYDLNISYESIIPENPPTFSETILPLTIIFIATAVIALYITRTNSRRRYFAIFFALPIAGALLLANSVSATTVQELHIKGKVAFTKIYTVTVDPNGGEYQEKTEPTIVKVRDGQKYHVETVERDTYKFVKWEINPSGLELDENNDIVITSDTNLKALWDEIYYTLTVKANGGKYKDVDTYTESFRPHEYADIVLPVRTGYDFVNWTRSDSETPFTGNSLQMEDNITLTANWTIQRFRITVNPNGGKFNGSTEVYTDTVDYGTEIDLTNHEYTDHEIKNWTKNNTDTLPADTQSITITENTDLVINWWSSIFHTVTIIPNGGVYDSKSEPSHYQVREGTKYTMLEARKEGSLFDYWHYTGTDNKFEGTEFIVEGDVSLTAEWAPIIARIERTGKLYSSIMKAEAEAITDDTITLLVDTEEIVTNTKKVTLDLYAHTVTGYIINTAEGHLTLINGEVNNYNSTIQDTANPTGAAVVNNGTLIMGVNDYQDAAMNEKVPLIDNNNIRLIGSEIGLEQNGAFYFYDGHIEGIIGLNGGYDGSPWYRDTFDGVVVNYFPFVTHNVTKDCQHVELSNADKAVSKTIEKGPIYYYNLQDNIDTSVRTGYKIYAVRDFDASYPISVPVNKEIVFDIIGFEVNLGDNVTIDGKLTITDSTEEKGILTSSKTIQNNDNIILQDVTLYALTTNTLMQLNGNLTMKNSTLKADKGVTLNVANTEVTLSLDANSKIISETTNPAINNNSPSLTLDNGSVIGTQCSVQNNSGKTFTMSNATIKGVVSAVCNYGGTFTINSGLVATERNGNTYAVFTDWNQGGTININGGKIQVKQTGNAQAYGIYKYTNGGSINMASGEIEVTSAATNWQDVYGIYTESTTNITGGHIKVTGSNTNYVYGIHVYGANTTIDGDDVLIEAINTNSGQARGINKERATVYLKKGTIKAEANTGAAIGIYNNYYYTTTNISGGSVTAHSKANNAFGVYGTDTSYENYITMTGGSVSATTDASDKMGVGLNSKIINITGGTVYGNSYGIHGALNSVTSNITLGKNEDPLYNGINTDDEGHVYPATPEIKGGVYGINGGNVYFYDGILKGGTTYINDPNIVKAIPDGTSRVVVDLTSPVEQDCWLEYDEDYLQLPDGSTYNSLTGAYNNVQDGETITVIRDASTPAVLPSNTKNITLDLNGHLLNYTQPLKNDGTMVITDSSSTKTGAITNTSWAVDRVINNNGTLTIEAGTISGNQCVVLNNSGKTFTMSNATIKGVVSAVCNYGGTFTINSGLVATERNGNTYAVFTDWNQGGTININGGKIQVKQTGNAQAYGIYKYTNGGSINMASGEIEVTSAATNWQDVYGIYTESTTNITGGHIKVTGSNTNYVYGIHVYGANTTIDGDDVLIEAINTNSGQARGINKERATVYLKKGTIKAEANTGAAIGIYNNYYYTTTNISGGSVTAHSKANNAFGVYGTDTSYENYITMTGGSVSATTDASDKMGVGLNSKIINITGGTVYGNSYGIHGALNSVTSNITLGKNEDPLYNGINTDDEGHVYPATPEIKGGVYGINGGNVYFYDGILKGGTAAYYDRNIKKIADNTYIHGRTETIDDKEYQVRYLANEEVLAKIGDAEYPTLQAAANAAEDGDEIDLVADNYLFYSLVFPADKTITVDLNGYEVITGNQITNKGNVTIYDSTGTPKLLDYREANWFITNEANASLTINGINIKARYAVYNKANGTVSLNNLKIGETSYSETAIENHGALNLNSTTIDATYRAVYTQGGSINIAGSDLRVYTYNNSSNVFTIYNENSTGNVNNSTLSTILKGDDEWYDAYYNKPAYFQTGANSDITMTGTTINGFTRIENGKFDFTNGTIARTEHVTNSRPVLYNAGTTTVDNSELTLTQRSYGSPYSDWAVAVDNRGTMTIKNNTTINHTLTYDAYYAASRIINNTGTLTLDSSTINQTYSNPHYANQSSGNVYGIYNTGTVNYQSMNFSISRTNAYGIYSETGTINYKSGNLTVNATNDAYGVYAAAGTVNISDGTIALNAGRNAFGLWTKNGTITLGEAEAIDSANYGTANANVSITSPHIKAIGGTYGIGITLEAGNFNFFDGKITQSSEIGPAVQADHQTKATLTNVEYLYQPETHTDDEGHTYFILEFMR